MCFSGDTSIIAPTSVSSYRRWYQDTSIVLTGVTHRKLVVTPGQPLLTHRGWVKASFVQSGDFLVVADHMSGPTRATIEQLWDADGRRGTIVPCPPHGFWGDGGSAGAEVEILGSAQRGLLAADQQPSAAPELLRGVLGVLAGPEAFGVATWPQAVARVPDLGRMWPDGEPNNRAAGLSTAARARLGSAVQELPDPPEDRLPVWTQALLGVSVELRMARVELARREVLRGWVFNEACQTGAFVANGVVVGSTG